MTALSKQFGDKLVLLAIIITARLKPPYQYILFRRDLRLDDNAGLYQTLKAGNPVRTR